MSKDRFADIWRERNRIQPEITNDWVNDWAKGRNQSLGFLIRISDEKLIMRINEIQNKLSTIPCFDPFPKDFLHITVKGCGFLAKSEEHEDDILVENQPKIASKAKESYRHSTNSAQCFLDLTSSQMLSSSRFMIKAKLES